MEKEKLSLNCALCNESQVRRDTKRNLMRAKASEAEFRNKTVDVIIGASSDNAGVRDAFILI